MYLAAQPIGLSLVELIRIENNLIYIGRLDVLNGTPLLDVKPYVPDFGNTHNIRIGWLEKVKGQVQNRKSDTRFNGKLLYNACHRWVGLLLEKDACCRC